MSDLTPIERALVAATTEILCLRAQLAEARDAAFEEAAAIKRWPTFLKMAQHMQDEIRFVVGEELCCALLAAEALGFKLVEREATEEMKKAADDLMWNEDQHRWDPMDGWAVWRDMHDAAPGIGEGGDA